MSGSSIDPTLPAGPMAYTADVRANFLAAKNEILALQASVTAPPPPLGVTDGSEAKPGDIGEFFYALLPTTNAILLASGVVRDVLTLNLPAGDFDIAGTINTSGSSGNIINIIGWISPVSATLPTVDNMSTFLATQLNFGTGGQSGVDPGTQLICGPSRLLTASPVTVYLSCQITWTGGTVQASGAIRARRMR